MTAAATRLPGAPPLLLGIGLLLWGWQTGFLVYALPMAVLLELSRWLRWRWNVTDRELNLVSDISGLIFFILVLYLFGKEGAGGIYRILAVMPFVLYLLLLIQRFSVRGTIKLSVLFISLRRLEADATLDMNREIDLSLPYFLLCLISASSGNQHPLVFFLVCALLVAALLWFLRPGRYHPAVWLALLVLSLSLAYAGQIGMQRAQREIELMLMNVFEKYMWRYRDPDRASTAIGSLGRLKLSDRILLRVDSAEKLETPLLLREASYTNYGYGVWSNVDSTFRIIDPDITPGNWTLQPQPGGHDVQISAYMFKERAVIPLPHGTTNIHDNDAFQITRNPYGAVKMETREGWIRYRVDYAAGRIADAPPGRDDLYLPERYRADFDRLAQEWRLRNKNTEQVLATVRQRFAEDYRYTLDNRSRYPRGRYLHHFLFDNRQGHCEFFATSTVLLLRAVGIPARYAVGYAVNEYSRLEDRYIVRARDAHSWTLAYVEGRWRVLDTTPPVWASLADRNASALEPLFDLVAWLKYRFARWQSEDDTEEAGSNTDYLLWLLPFLLIFLAWRLYHGERGDNREHGGKRGGPGAGTQQGADSALYTLITRLEQSGYFRRPGETLASWFSRLDNGTLATDLQQVLLLHYRYRFDPAGNNREVRARLAERVDALLASGLPGNGRPRETA